MMTAMEKLARKVLETGTYVVSDQGHYGGFCTKESIEQFKKLSTKKVENTPKKINSSVEIRFEIDLKQPGWPVINTSALYADTVPLLHKAAKDGLLPYHVVLGETLRATDCRLTEILFLCGIFPDRDWCQYENQLSFSDKIFIVQKILPEKILPKFLIKNVNQMRNEAEHQYAEPEQKEVERAKDTMDSFFGSTEKLLSVLGEFSMFTFEVDGEEDLVVIQIMRESGALLVFHDGNKPITNGRIWRGIIAREIRNNRPITNPLAQQLIQKILGNIQHHIDTDIDYWRKLGFIC